MVIQPGGTSVGGIAAGSSSAALAIPTLSDGSQPKWIYIAMMATDRAMSVVFGSYLRDAAKALDASVEPTAANPVVVTTNASHSYVNGDEVFISGSAMVELNNRWFTIDNKTADAFELVDENGLDRTTGLGGNAYKNLFLADATLANGVGVSSGAGVVVNVAGHRYYKTWASNASAAYTMTPLAGINPGG